MRLHLNLLSALLLHLGFLAYQAWAQQGTTYPYSIQGPGFLSPVNGTTVSNVEGVVTAIGPDGYYIQTPDDKSDSDDRTSEGLYVSRDGALTISVIPPFCDSLCHLPSQIFGKVPSTLQRNDLIRIGSALVTEYRSSSSYLRLTELTRATNITVLKTNRGSSIKPVRIGKDRSPPTEYIGTEDFFAIPSGTVDIESARGSSLQVDRFGADFWESLENMLVSLHKPTALGKISQFGEVWALPGDIRVTSKNSRGGVTVAARDVGSTLEWDVNPETINIGEPLDGTSNPKVIKLGDEINSFEGIVSYAFGVPVIYPLTAIQIVKPQKGNVRPTSFRPSGRCSSVVTAGYNVENLAKGDSRISRIGQQIDDLLNNPDVIGFIEIQDDDGATNSGTVSANETLADLANAIKKAKYLSAAIDPINNQDGGAPGGNIRPAFLYRSDHVKLSENIPAGTATDPVEVTVDQSGQATLSLNPGLIDPTNEAWESSRKPLVAQFELNNGKERFFVIAVHFTSKGGSGQAWGPSQAPRNGGVEQRIQQGKYAHRTLV